jgi:hypothetical protein
MRAGLIAESCTWLFAVRVIRLLRAGTGGSVSERW